MSKDWPQGWSIALFLVLLLAGTGCVTPNRLANRLLTAPNQQGRYPAARMAEAWSKALTTRDPFLYQRVIVGDPRAELLIAELPPGKYEVDLASKFEEGPDGKKFLNFHFHYKNAGNVEPIKEERGTVVILHGYMMSKEVMYPWAFLLARAGFRVIAVDLRGHGQSTGGTVSFGKRESADVMQVLDHLAAAGRIREPGGVMGISMGADLALHWAARDERVETVVAIAPYNQPEDAFLRFAREMKLPVSEHAAREALGIAAGRLEVNWKDWSGESAMRLMRVPVLIVGGAEDRIVPASDLEYLHQLAPSGSRLLVISEASHDTIGLWLHEVGKPVLAWFLQQATGVPLMDEPAASGQ